MKVHDFLNASSMRSLALARLDSCEYSIFLYLVYSQLAGLDPIITTEGDLALAIGTDESEVCKGLKGLNHKKMIKIKVKQNHSSVVSTPASMSLSCQLDIDRWSVLVQKRFAIRNAIVYPFGAGLKGKPLTLLPGDSSDEVRSITPCDNVQTWRRITRSFLEGRKDEEISSTLESEAMRLADAHHIDQILLLIRYFGRRLASLEELLSAWDEYQDTFERETQRVDFAEARKKHEVITQDLKKSAALWLSRAEQHHLSSDEECVLQLLIEHRHPRRQLFWAYQMRGRYQNLANFFLENADRMLAVTTTGIIMRHPTTPKK